MRDRSSLPASISRASRRRVCTRALRDRQARGQAELASHSGAAVRLAPAPRCWRCSRRCSPPRRRSPCARCRSTGACVRGSMMWCIVCPSWLQRRTAVLEVARPPPAIEIVCPGALEVAAVVVGHTHPPAGGRSGAGGGDVAAEAHQHTDSGSPARPRERRDRRPTPWRWRRGPGDRRGDADRVGSAVELDACASPLCTWRVHAQGAAAALVRRVGCSQQPPVAVVSGEHEGLAERRVDVAVRSACAARSATCSASISSGATSTVPAPGAHSHARARSPRESGCTRDRSRRARARRSPVPARARRRR